MTDSSGELERALALLAAGRAAAAGRGDPAEVRRARESLERAVAVLQAVDPSVQRDRAVAESAHILGRLELMHGSAARALPWCTLAVERWTTLGDDALAGAAATNLGLAQTTLGEYDSAIASLRRSIQAKFRARDERGLGITHNNLGLVLLAQGLVEQALSCFTDARAYFRKVADARGEAYAEHNLGELAMHGNDVHRAIGHLQRSLELKEQVDDVVGGALTRASLTSAFVRAGDLRAAGDELARARAATPLADSPELEVRLLAAEARLRMAEGQLAQARLLATRAVAMAEELGSAAARSDAVRVLATLTGEREERDRLLATADRQAGAARPSEPRWLHDDAAPRAS